MVYGFVYPLAVFVILEIERAVFESLGVRRTDSGCWALQQAWAGLVGTQPEFAATNLELDIIGFTHCSGLYCSRLQNWIC